MHYTSIENIHKVIDPLFLNDYREKYDKNNWEMGLFYLKNGHAEIRGMMDLKEEFAV